MHKGRREATPDLEIAELIDNRYRIQKYLDEGATSRVYLAEDTALQKTVALKVLKPSVNHRRMLLRFEQEARISLSISHPNICRVFGFGRLADERPYLVLECLEGTTLHTLQRGRNRLSPLSALAIVQQLLSALSLSHRRGIVHRDVKPSNVFVTKEDGGLGRVKLLDFGLAKAPANLAVIHTRPGQRCGTPGYAAPETLSGGGVTHHADLWSTGVILFELLAGERPFRDPPPGASAFAVVCGPSRSLREFVPDVSDELVELVDAALEKEPAARIQTADEFSRRLAGLIDELGPPGALTPRSTLPPPETHPTIPVLNRYAQSLAPPPTSTDGSDTSSITIIDPPRSPSST